MPHRTPTLFEKKYVYFALLMATSAHATPVGMAFTADNAMAASDYVPKADVFAIEKRLAQLQSQSGVHTNTARFSVYENLQGELTDSMPVSRIDDNTSPIGLIEQTADTPPPLTKDMAGIDPLAYLPDSKQQLAVPDTLALHDDSITKKPSIIKRLYARFLNDGAEIAPRLSAAIYIARPKVPEESIEAPPSVYLDSKEHELTVGVTEKSWVYAKEDAVYAYDESTMTLDAVQEDTEPFKNIKAALEKITVESTPSFSAGLPRLRDTVSAAARAVGYYELDFVLRHEGGGKIGVIITKLGKPAVVETNWVEIRGAGRTLPEFAEIAASPKIRQNASLHHGNYEETKEAISTVSSDKGFFDGKWLDSSVDVLLPDNVADVSLIYDTGDRYMFDEVVFFTTDPDTGGLTADPDKLPVKPEILRKLVTFDVNDGFERKQVVQLSGDLTGTRYFNSSNVEVVLPITTEDATVQYETTQTPTEDTQNETVVAEISPIDFSASEALIEKMGLVLAKANRLYNSPDNRVLDAKRSTSKTLLGKVSDVVSHVVKAILPDESKDEPMIDEDAVPSTLANKKSPVAVHRDKKVPLYVFVAAERPRDAQLGLGWGSDTGFRATGKIDHHLINKDGYQAGVEAAISPKNKSVNAYVSRPLSHPLNDKLIANVKYAEESIKQQNDTTVLVRMGEANVFRNLRYPSDWHRTYGIRYRLDTLDSDTSHVVAGGEAEALPPWAVAGNATQQALLATASLSKTVQNDIAAPTRGYRQYYSLEAGSGKLGTDANMAIVRAGLGGLYSFGDNRYGEKRAHQLIGRADLGYLWTDDFSRVPYKLRFFTGGEQSIRGYNHQSISPVSSKGYLTGGQALAVASLEYNYEVLSGIRAAVFTDLGGAYDKDFKADTKFGVGVGVRYASPIGTVRLDVAKGIEKQKTPIKLHFLIGMPF